MQTEKALAWSNEKITAVEARITGPLQEVCKLLTGELESIGAINKLERYEIKMPKSIYSKNHAGKMSRLEIDKYSIEELEGYGALFISTIKDAMSSLRLVADAQNLEDEKVDHLRKQFEVAIGVHCAIFEDALEKSCAILADSKYGAILADSDQDYRSIVGSTALLRNELHAINENLHEQLVSIMLLR